MPITIAIFFISFEMLYFFKTSFGIYKKKFDSNIRVESNSYIFFNLKYRKSMWENNIKLKYVDENQN